MSTKQMVHMNQGQGDTSYARNSSFQNAEQNKMKSLIEAAIIDICSSSSDSSLPGKILIADLGCSSGPNALETGINCRRGHPQLLPSARAATTRVTPCILSAQSNSLHWLSKAPEDLTKNQIPAYDIDEHARMERIHMVFEAYAKQFRKDFTLFLELRAKELVQGGRMVLSLIGRRSDVITTKFSYLSGIVAQILSVMVSEGVIDKTKYDSFYVPVYAPSSEELREIIQEEGSFSIMEMRVHDPRTDMNSALSTPSRFVNLLRALFEPILVQHFGDVMDEFARTAERRWSLEGSLQEERARNPRAMLVVSLALL
ncbi:hypothetical protein ACQ4PT_024094 [Festuca glaucescens]